MIPAERKKPLGSGESWVVFNAGQFRITISPRVVELQMTYRSPVFPVARGATAEEGVAFVKGARGQSSVMMSRVKWASGRKRKGQNDIRLCLEELSEIALKVLSAALTLRGLIGRLLRLRKLRVETDVAARFSAERMSSEQRIGSWDRS